MVRIWKIYSTSRGNFFITWNIKYAYHNSEKSKFFADYIFCDKKEQTQAKQMGTVKQNYNY